MQITVTVSDAIARDASTRGISIVEFVESLIDKGMAVAAAGAPERPVFDSAMDRIRALHSKGATATR